MSRRIVLAFPALTIFAFTGWASAAPLARLGPPPTQVVEEFHLADSYAKHLLVEGFPVLGSPAVSDYALREAAYLIRKMVGHRPDVLRELVRRRIRFVVMAPSEMTTDVPEHADLLPADYWDRRARGLGATQHRPAVSCGEENLLGLAGDPYATECILVHEFSHAIHEMAIAEIDTTFGRRLEAAYQRAIAATKWKGTYAATNRMEYWAEGAQSWFECNRTNDSEHNDVDTRRELKAYDRPLAALLEEVFGDGTWRYTRPAQRSAVERAHLAGFDAATAPAFAWPKPDETLAKLPRREPSTAPAASPTTASPATSILFSNRRAGAVEIVWLDFQGERKRYATLQAGGIHPQPTYEGHVWLVLEGETSVAAFVAARGATIAEIR